MPEIKRQLLAVNFTKGREHNKILGICDHITAGTASSALHWFNNRQSQSSCHYLVCKNGDIIQLVEDYDTAWCQGIINKPTSKLYQDMNRMNPNAYLIGIEHEGTDGALTPAQYESTLWLHKHLIKKHSIPISRYNIIGHYELDSVNRAGCPGKKFPWTILMNDLFPKPEPVKIPEVKLDKETIDAINFLVRMRELNSADYWLENLKDNSKVEGKYAAIIIKRLAEIIQKFIELEEKEKLLTRDQLRQILR
jgi:N-acetylmuramoyl-L-alanine amidase